MKYTSKIIRVVRNNSENIEVPFKAKYLYLKVVAIEGDQKLDTTPIILKLDDGEDIVMISSLFQLDFEFTKLTITIGNISGEDIQFFYFISGNDIEKSESRELIIEELKTLELRLKKLIRRN